MIKTKIGESDRNLVGLLYGKETHLIRRGKEPYRIKCCQ
jgi:hypothetical protein